MKVKDQYRNCPLFNQRGSALEIVLIIFLALMITIISYGMYMKESYRLYQYSEMMNQEREIEVLLKYYFREKADHDELSTGVIVQRHSHISYKVKNNEDSYQVTSLITLPDVSYTTDMVIDKKTLNVTQFDYL